MRFRWGYSISGPRWSSKFTLTWSSLASIFCSKSFTAWLLGSLLLISLRRRKCAWRSKRKNHLWSKLPIQTLNKTSILPFLMRVNANHLTGWQSRRRTLFRTAWPFTVSFRRLAQLQAVSSVFLFNWGWNIRSGKIRRSWFSNGRAHTRHFFRKTSLSFHLIVDSNGLFYTKNRLFENLEFCLPLTVAQTRDSFENGAISLIQWTFERQNI